jgi:hypothetical protein
MASRWAGSWQRRPIAAYDRLYRWLYGLDQPTSIVGPVLRLAVRRSRRTVRLADGGVVHRGDLIGVLHLNNERVVLLRESHERRESTGLEFRRQFFASLAELARLTDPGYPLAGIRAFTATTIFHHGLRRAGFAVARGDASGSALVGAYQRALLGALNPSGRRSGVMRGRAQHLWISRGALRAAFLDRPRRAPANAAVNPARVE